MPRQHDRFSDSDPMRERPATVVAKMFDIPGVSEELHHGTLTIPLKQDGLAENTRKVPGKEYGIPAEIRDGLVAILKIGEDTYLGIDRLWNGKRRAVDQVRVSVLPLGDTQTHAVEKDSSVTVEQIMLQALPNAGYHDVRIGRSVLGEKGGSLDQTVSSDHVVIRVYQDGEVVEVIDHSTNGTKVVSSKTITQALYSYNGQKDELHHQIADGLEALQKSDYIWRSRDEGFRIIDPSWGSLK